MKKTTKLDIFIAGVGGQGTLFASRVLGNYAVLKGMDCKLSEVHGMAQRGGSVVTHVRTGDKIYSPIVAEGAADALLAFEQLEALRNAHMIKKNGFIITAVQKLPPAAAANGTAVYPDNILDRLKNITENLTAVDAQKLALDAGNVKAANTVMLGALTKAMGLDIEVMRKALKLTVPPAALEVNMKALESGYSTGNREQGTGNREQGTGNREQGTGNRC